MKIYKPIGIFILLAMLSLPFLAQAQPCRGFAKRYCRVALDDYLSIPQNLTAEMETGETTEMSMVFYKKHDYRIIICSEDHLGEINFKILDTKGNVLFDNRDHGMTPFWDFSMTTTKRLVVEVSAQGFSTGEDMLDAGCVALIIGHRLTPPKGFH